MLWHRTGLLLVTIKLDTDDLLLNYKIKLRGNNKTHPDDSKNEINLKESLFQNKRVTCQMALFTNFFADHKV